RRRSGAPRRAAQRLAHRAAGPDPTSTSRAPRRTRRPLAPAAPPASAPSPCPFRPPSVPPRRLSAAHRRDEIVQNRRRRVDLPRHPVVPQRFLALPELLVDPAEEERRPR